jgi:hypothetical protein
MRGFWDTVVGLRFSALRGGDDNVASWINRSIAVQGFFCMMASFLPPIRMKDYHQAMPKGLDASIIKEETNETKLKCQYMNNL